MKLKHGLAAAVLGSTLAGCAPGGSDDYRAYVVSYIDEQVTDDCYGQDGPDLNEQEDASDFWGWDYLGVFEVDDTAFLHFPSHVMVGTRDGDAFEFAAESINVTYSTDGETREQAIRADVIRFTEARGTIQGTVETSRIETCDGSGCAFLDDLDCTYSYTLYGREFGGDSDSLPTDLYPNQ